MGRYLYRIFGAWTLDAGMYETLEADPSVNSQAALTVVLATLAAGVGTSGMHGLNVRAVATSTVLALALWVSWGVLMHQIGSRVFPAKTTRTSLGELLRTTGFAAAPGFFQVFAIFPGATRPVFAATGLWMFVAMVVAIRHALDYDNNMRAVAVAGSALLLCAALALSLAASFSSTVS